MSKRRVARRIVSEEVAETSSAEKVVEKQEVRIPDLLTGYVPPTTFPVNEDVRNFFSEFHQEMFSGVSTDASETVKHKKKPSKQSSTVTVKRRQKKAMEERVEAAAVEAETENSNIDPDAIIFRDANGEIVNLTDVVNSVSENNDSATTGASSTELPELKFVEIKTVKKRSTDKNMSKRDKIQDNTSTRIVKPSVVSSKTKTNNTTATIVEHFDRDMFVAQYFVPSACPCNDTVKNGKYYAYDIHGCIIRSDCLDKKNNPYCWRFNEKNEPVSVYAEMINGEVNRNTLIAHMKQKYTSAFGQKGTAYKLYKKCYGDKVDL